MECVGCHDTEVYGLGHQVEQRIIVNRKVLIVEDDKEISSILQTFLEQKGMRCGRHGTDM